MKRTVTSLENRKAVRQPATPPTKKMRPKKGKGSYSRKGIQL